MWPDVIVSSNVKSINRGRRNLQQPFAHFNPFVIGNADVITILLYRPFQCESFLTLI